LSHSTACLVRDTEACLKNGLAVDGYNPSDTKAPPFTAIFGTTEVVP